MLSALTALDAAPTALSDARDTLDRYEAQARAERVGPLDVSQLRDLRPLIDTAAAMRALHPREGVLT